MTISIIEGHEILSQYNLSAKVNYHYYPQCPVAYDKGRINIPKLIALANYYDNARIEDDEQAIILDPKYTPTFTYIDPKKQHDWGHKYRVTQSGWTWNRLHVPDNVIVEVTVTKETKRTGKIKQASVFFRIREKGPLINLSFKTNEDKIPYLIKGRMDKLTPEQVQKNNLISMTNFLRLRPDNVHALLKYDIVQDAIEELKAPVEEVVNFEGEDVTIYKNRKKRRILE